jgi:biotin carboxylase
MTHDPAVLVIGGKLKIVRKARAMGLDVVYFQFPESYTDAHRQHVRASFLFDYTDVSQAVQLARVARRRYPIGNAVSLTEHGLTVAGHVNDALGLPGTGADVAMLFKDKWLMRRHLADHGLPGIGAEPLTDAEGVRRFGARHGWPVIVKPADSSASVGVFTVDAPGQADDVCRQVAAMRRSCVADHVTLDRFMLEQFVPGPEVSVEAVSFGGRHLILAITEKLLADGCFVEIGHALPARLDADLERAIVAATVAFLDAVGLRDGPSHTEFRLGGPNPVLIESHNRAGGDRIHDLVECAFGVDMDNVALAWPQGLMAPLAGVPEARCAAATRFFVAPPGEVVAIEGIEEARRHPGVVALDMAVAVGDTVRPLRTSWDRCGQIVVTAPDTAQATALADQLAGRIKIVTR